MESLVFFEGWQLHGRLHLIWSPHFLWITFSYSIHLFLSMRDDYYCKTISFLEKLVCFGWIRMIFRQDYWWQILLEYIINYLTNNMSCTRQLAIAAIIKWLQSILLLQPFFLCPEWNDCYQFFRAPRVELPASVTKAVFGAPKRWYSLENVDLDSRLPNTAKVFHGDLHGLWLRLCQIFSHGVLFSLLERGNPTLFGPTSVDWIMSWKSKAQ